ncbi:hypothetical protein [Burkholderia glumae]|uniref:hypothetical protein n=1 Tax=Burkholderia glumae TaxID=337 RepID=UPI003B9D3CC6
MNATTTPVQENKPCPFCRAHLTDRNANGFYCHPENECWLAAFEFDDDGSIQKWNTRVDPAVSRMSQEVSVAQLLDDATGDDLLQLDVLLARFRDAVWCGAWRAGAGSHELIDYETVGKEYAEKIQAHVRTILSARSAVSPATAEKNEWKDAVDAELVTIQSTADIYAGPKEAVKALIDWHVQVALDPAVSAAARSLNADTAEAIDRYQAVCAAAYQLAGIVGAPLRFLDALSDAANGEPMSADEALNLLPVGLDEIDEVNRSAAAPADVREPSAWVTPEGDRSITQSQKQGMLRDGGAGATSVRPFSIACYAGAVPDDSGNAVLTAARAVIREELDSVTVHPCDEHNDEARAQKLCEPMLALYRAVTAVSFPDKNRGK